MKRVLAIIVISCLLPTVTLAVPYAEPSRLRYQYKIGNFFVSVDDYWIERHDGTDYLYVEIKYTSHAEFSMFFETGVDVMAYQDNTVIVPAQRTVPGAPPYERIFPGQEGVYREVYELFDTIHPVSIYLTSPKSAELFIRREFDLQLTEARYVKDTEDDADAEQSDDDEMKHVSLYDFTENAFDYVLDASEGNGVIVDLANGNSTVVISRSDFEMYRQALQLCTEHPEWTTTK